MIANVVTKILGCVILTGACLCAQSGKELQPVQPVDQTVITMQQEQYSQLKKTIVEALKQEKKTWIQKVGALCTSEWATQLSAFVVWSIVYALVFYPCLQALKNSGFYGYVAALLSCGNEVMEGLLHITIVFLVFIFTTAINLIGFPFFNKLFRSLARLLEDRPKTCLAVLNALTKRVQDGVVVVPEAIKTVLSQLPEQITDMQAEKAIDMLLDLCDAHIAAAVAVAKPVTKPVSMPASTPMFKKAAVA